MENGFCNEAIVEQLKKLGYHHDGYLRGNQDDREPNWMFVLDLEGKSEAELLKSFDQQTRWSINKTLKLGIEVKDIKKEEVSSFKEIMEHTAKRRGFEDHDALYYQHLFDCFVDDGKMLALKAELDVKKYEAGIRKEKQRAEEELATVLANLAAVANSKKFTKKKKVVEEELALLEKKQKEIEELKKDGDCILLAASTFVLYGDEVIYLYSGAYDHYMRFNAPYALQWYIIRYALAHGYHKYNFYGISGFFEKGQEGYGIYEFKKGFTGNVVELIGDFTYYVSPSKYRIYRALKKLRDSIKHA